MTSHGPSSTRALPFYGQNEIPKPAPDGWILLLWFFSILLAFDAAGLALCAHQPIQSTVSLLGSTTFWWQSRAELSEVEGPLDHIPLKLYPSLLIVVAAIFVAPIVL
jgi:hypothetical protein